MQPATCWQPFSPQLTCLRRGLTSISGGSILSQILASSRPAIKDLSISVLVRRQAEADVLAAKGVRPILFKDLDESDVLRKAASEHDVVIHAASGFHPPSAVALIEGLGERKRATGKEVYYIHVSGLGACSKVGALTATRHRELPTSVTIL